MSNTSTPSQHDFHTTASPLGRGVTADNSAHEFAAMDPKQEDRESDRGCGALIVFNHTRKLSWRAIRFSRIPATINKDKFVDLLEELTQNNRSNVLSWSFCPDATTVYEQRFNVATVTFEEVPTEFSNRGTTRFEHAIGTTYTDDHFFGLTPLYSPPRNETTVE
jgi:hypothetical protein